MTDVALVHETEVRPESAPIADCSPEEQLEQTERNNAQAEAEKAKKEGLRPH